MTETELAQAKKRLRAEIREKRRTLDPAYVRAADAEIARRLTALPEFQAARSIFCFISLPQEIDTLPILARAWAEGKLVAAPRCGPEGSMRLLVIRGPEDLAEPGFFGIREPKEDCPEVSPEDIDLTIVPCVTADRTGMRLGYGGGYYDRFFAEKGAGARAVLCRTKLLSECVPAGAHDHRIPVVVTEEGVIRIPQGGADPINDLQQQKENGHVGH